MKALIKILIVLTLINLAFFVESKDKKDKKVVNKLIGTWKYQGCTFKNTSVTGTITFKPNGKFDLKIHVRDDYPVKNNFSGTYNYQIKGKELITDYKSDYGFCKYFIVAGGYLYFTQEEVNVIEDRYENDRQIANWRFKLKKVDGNRKNNDLDL